MGACLSRTMVEEQRSASLDHEDADNIDYMLTAMKSHSKREKSGDVDGGRGSSTGRAIPNW